MPHVRFNGVKKDGSVTSFIRVAGCFCILGKTTGHTYEIKKHMERVHMSEFTSITWLGFALENQEQPENCVIDYLRERLSFFRVIEGETSDIYKTGQVTLNVKDYSLNEVMHCLWWLRSFCVHHVQTPSSLNKCPQGYRIFDQMVKKGVPEAVAAMYVLLPWNTKSGYCSAREKSYNVVQQGDENLLKLSHVKFADLVQVISHGVQVKDKYWTPGTLQELTLRDDVYEKNISNFLSRQSKLVTTVNKVIKGLIKDTLKECNKAAEAIQSKLGFNFLSDSSVTFTTEQQKQNQKEFYRLYTEKVLQVSKEVPKKPLTWG